VSALAPRKGWINYIDIEVTWDGIPEHYGTWTAIAVNYRDFTPGTVVGFSDTFEMEYDFELRGSILSFDEVYVSGVEAHPQEHHVVLHDSDGDGIYTGTCTVRFDWPGVTEFICMDVIEYEVTTADGVVTNFEYVEHEYYKIIE